MASAGVAHAQDSTPAAPNVAAGVSAPASAVPWYQRFTTSSGVTEQITGERENDRMLAPAWTLNQRWGVTLDVRESEQIERVPGSAAGDQASVGAYYQFTPRMRVGGQLSVEAQPAAPITSPRLADEEPNAGVRIESAFRF